MTSLPIERLTRLISASALLLVGLAVWSHLDGLAVRFGGTFGIPVSKHTFWLPPAIKLGLSDPIPTTTSGPLVWAKAQDGFDPILAAYRDGRYDRGHGMRAVSLTAFDLPISAAWSAVLGGISAAFYWLIARAGPSAKLKATCARLFGPA